MKCRVKFYIFGLALFIAIPVLGQHHYSSWVHRNTTDTTIVRCSNDSLTMMKFPSGQMMSMMFPDSVYCRINRMPMDSLQHPFDSTFLGWHRMQIGTDSTHFDYMHCGSGDGSNYMMQFMKNFRCELYWDTLKTDSLHLRWRPTRVRGWNGSQWVTLSNVSISGNTATVATSQAYSALAIVGEPQQVTEASASTATPNNFVLDQNFPNPFNPETIISFSLPTAESITLKVYNMLGKEIAVLVNSQTLSAGQHFVKFDALNLSSGIYFYTIHSGKFTTSKKMLLLR